MVLSTYRHGVGGLFLRSRRAQMVALMSAPAFGSDDIRRR